MIYREIFIIAQARVSRIVIHARTILYGGRFLLISGEVAYVKFSREFRDWKKFPRIYATMFHGTTDSLEARVEFGVSKKPETSVLLRLELF